MLVRGRSATTQRGRCASHPPHTPPPPHPPASLFCVPFLRPFLLPLLIPHPTAACLACRTKPCHDDDTYSPCQPIEAEVRKLIKKEDCKGAPAPGHCFAVVTPARTWHLCPEEHEEEAVERWMALLRSAKDYAAAAMEPGDAGGCGGIGSGGGAAGSGGGGNGVGREGSSESGRQISVVDEEAYLSSEADDSSDTDAPGGFGESKMGRDGQGSLWGEDAAGTGGGGGSGGSGGSGRSGRASRSSQQMSAAGGGESGEAAEAAAQFGTCSKWDRVTGNLPISLLSESPWCAELLCRRAMMQEEDDGGGGGAAGSGGGVGGVGGGGGGVGFVGVAGARGSGRISSIRLRGHQTEPSSRTKGSRRSESDVGVRRGRPRQAASDGDTTRMAGAEGAEGGGGAESGGTRRRGNSSWAPAPASNRPGALTVRVRGPSVEDGSAGSAGHCSPKYRVSSPAALAASFDPKPAAATRQVSREDEEKAPERIVVGRVTAAPGAKKRGGSSRRLLFGGGSKGK